MLSPLARAIAFAEDYGLRIPILMAPMAGACPASLAIAVGNAGGMGACGTLLMQPEAIAAWVAEYKSGSNGAFQLNIWVRDPEPFRDAENEARLRDFLSGWGPPVPADATDRAPPDFDAQCQAMLAANPPVISSIMGAFEASFVTRMKEANIRWFVTATTVKEALMAQEAGADVIVAQGMEAGGHRGTFRATDAETELVGLFSLVPAIVDAVDVPVIATGGIADARGIAAALILGASAVQIGTGLLRSPEAKIAPAWADAIGSLKPEDTISTRAFSGRLGRSIRNRYAVAAASAGAPTPAPYPVQRGLTQAMRDEATRQGDIDRMQAWAGQSGRLARSAPAGDIVTDLWREAVAMLSE